MSLRTTGVILLIVSLTLACAADSNPPSLPNVVVVLADDLGSGDVQTLNPDSKIPTPNLDAMAAEGMTFVDAHTPSAVCTPTRYGLVTGRYAWRTHLKRGVLNGYGEPLMAQGRATFGTFLQDIGYTTAVVGKWHLGLGFAKDEAGEFDFSKPVSDGPHTRGFDESFVIPASLDFPPYVYIVDGEITGHPLDTQAAIKFPPFMREGEIGSNFDPEAVLDKLVETASEFIKRSASGDKPFFVYVPLTAPHKPVWPAERFKGATDLGPYGDFIVQVDDAAGGILRAVDEAGVRDNTLVIFTSDNGSFMYRRDDPDEPDHTDDETIQAYRAENHTANGVYRGTKADVYEAGHRVPFFARWPGQIEAGSVERDTICLTDVFATLADIAGADLPEGAAEDSFSFLPLLRGGARSEPRPSVINHSSSGMFAIRDGPWKLIAGNGSGGREQPRGTPFERPYQLYNLDDDISERNNVYEQNPELAQELESQLDMIRGL